MAEPTVEQGSNRFGNVSAFNSHILQGNFNGLTINSIAAARPNYTGLYSHSSITPVTTYVHRRALHAKLKGQLHNNIKVGSQDVQRVVVHGLGGAGKSQLVLNYLRQYRSDYSAVFWVVAGSRASIERDYLSIYRLLFDIHTTKETELPKIDDVVAAVKSWFNERDGRWLFVFDSADTIGEEDDERSLDLAQYLPDLPRVHVVITTRSSLAQDMTMAEAIEVGQMDVSEASELFKKCAKLGSKSQEVEVKAIVEELGCLALAVNLAGYYVSQTRRIASDLRQYLPEYRRRRKELLSQKPRKVVHQYSESVLTTWETSFSAIQHRSVAAARFLTMLACLSPDDIFMSLFCDESGACAPAYLWHSIVSTGQAVDLYAVESYLRILQEYSLIQWKEDQESYSLHQLVHAWGYERLELDEQRQFSYAALRLVEQAASKDQIDLTTKLRLIPHVVTNFGAVSHAYRIPDIGTESILYSLSTTCSFLSEMGRYADAQTTLDWLVKAYREARGEDHPDTITAMSNLAVTLRDQGNPDEAASTGQEVLDKMRRILGDEHPDTVSSMSNLSV